MPSALKSQAISITNTTTSHTHKASSPVHVVTPTKEDSPLSLSEGPIEPMLHTPTATHGGLTHTSSPFRPSSGTTESLRYPLTSTTGTPPSLLPPMSPPSKTSSRKTRLSATGTAGSTTATTTGPGNSSSSTSSSRLQLLRQDPNACKIFLLLLQPQSKIFELIQLLYAPHDTTVGDLLNLIPSHATEPALGSQDYVGLCRPKTHQELLDLDMLATSTIGTSGKTSLAPPSAQIVLGEILVAIPQGYTGTTVATLSQQILSNPKIVKLLKRADPLAPKPHRHGHGHRRSSNSNTGGGRRSSGANTTSTGSTTRRSSKQHRSSSSRHHHHLHNVLEKHDEVDESIEDKLESERRMQQAMEHAATEAAAANAACGGAGLTTTIATTTSSCGATTNRSTNLAARDSFAAHSIISLDSVSTNGGSSTTTSFLEDMDSQQESLDESFSSWSKSFDASFSAQSASICSGLSKRTSRRKHRQERRITIFKRCAMAGWALMIVMYQMDPQKEHLQHQHDLRVQTPMGATGMFQWAFFLLLLYKVERLIRLNRAAQSYQRQQHQLIRQHQAAKNGQSSVTTTPTPIIYMTEQRSCPFLKASGRALERFKTKYAKKLQRLTRRQQQAVASAATAHDHQDPYYTSSMMAPPTHKPSHPSHGSRYNQS